MVNSHPLWPTELNPKIGDTLIITNHVVEVSHAKEKLCGGRRIRTYRSPKATDLQSVRFDHFRIPPFKMRLTSYQIGTHRFLTTWLETCALSSKCLKKHPLTAGRTHPTVHLVGFEPTTLWLKIRCSNNHWAKGAIRGSVQAWWNHTSPFLFTSLKLVDSVGLEPTTITLWVCCSDHLS